MSAYFFFSLQAFRNNLVFRADYLIGLLSTLTSIFVFTAIWQAIYAQNHGFNGISFQMVVTNFVLLQALSHTFKLNDALLASKIRDGSIANELLKPLSLHGTLLASNLGDIAFRLLAQFIPALILASCFIRFSAPAHWQSLPLFMLSVAMGFALLYLLSSMVAISAFWLRSTWSLTTIKNISIQVLSGALIPVWFMPDALATFVKASPFGAIYFTPLSIYLGKADMAMVWRGMALQAIWIAALFLLTQMLWRAGVRRLEIDGG